MRHKDLILQFWRELRENCFVPCFRQWKLEDLCYKSGDLVTEIYYMNQVSSQFWILLSWLYCISLLTSMCVCARVCVPLAHRKATSLPHHHPFGLFLGRGQAPNWNGLPTVSIMNLLFFFLNGKARIFWFSLYPIFLGVHAASDLIFINKTLDAGRWFDAEHTGAQLLCEAICFWGIRLFYTGMRLLFSHRSKWPSPSAKTTPNSVLAAQTCWTHLKRHHRGQVCVLNSFPLKALL